MELLKLKEIKDIEVPSRKVNVNFYYDIEELENKIFLMKVYERKFHSKHMPNMKIITIEVS